MGFGARMPLWFFSANRPRSGKDYCAGVAQIVYLGHEFEDAALGDNPEETSKRITAALLAGRRQIHFANCQGHLDDRYFIQAITGSTWNARQLGSNNAASDLKLPNEAEYSISANVGLTYREDVEPRSRKIELAYYEENENERTFPNPDLHGWLKENRALVLSAVHACFEHWVKKGMPAGKTSFISFPKWARVVGGVMTACGLGDPCRAHEEQDLIGGDQRTMAMRALYELGYSKFPGRKVRKSELYAAIRDEQSREGHDERLNWFGDLNGQEKNKAEIKLGKAIPAFQRRELCGIRMTLDASLAKSQQHEVCFERV